MCLWSQLIRRPQKKHLWEQALVQESLRSKTSVLVGESDSSPNVAAEDDFISVDVGDFSNIHTTVESCCLPLGTCGKQPCCEWSVAQAAECERVYWNPLASRAVYCFSSCFGSFTRLGETLKTRLRWETLRAVRLTGVLRGAGAAADVWPTS